MTSSPVTRVTVNLRLSSAAAALNNPPEYAKNIDKAPLAILDKLTVEETTLDITNARQSKL